LFNEVSLASRDARWVPLQIVIDAAALRDVAAGARWRTD
jgi:hypothetical protein